MTRNRLIIVAVVLLFVALGGNAYLGYRNSLSISQQQRTLGVSQKQSTHTRVVTVAQRCDLTNLVLSFAPPAKHAALEKSLNGCEKQLVQVKQIDARTPTIK